MQLQDKIDVRLPEREVPTAIFSAGRGGDAMDELAAEFKSDF